ncbi:MAG: hypothetical protein JW770_08070 [Actinobacteria bacterium]|nr:hypothetical protein [Actinomycetota bacterium]
MQKDTGSGIYLEKLEKIMPYWIKHNSEHINEHQKWAEDARKIGLTEIADELEAVVDLMRKANSHIDSLNEKIKK